jgi:hypothetical protein
MRTHDYISVDIAALSAGKSAPVHTSKFPVCWEVEAQKPADTNGDDEDEDALIR